MYRTIVLSLMIAATAIAQASQTVQEPEYNDVFFAIESSSGKLLALERQTASFHVSGTMIGGAKVTSDIKYAKSPARIDSATAFVVRSAAVASSADPTSLYILRLLTPKKNKRESPMANVGSAFTGKGLTTELDKDSITVRFVKYGENSFKIVPETPLAPGEYAFMNRKQMADVFCFGVDK